VSIRSRFAIVGALLALVAGCASIDFAAVPRTPSHAIADGGDTRLGRAIAAEARRRPGESGFAVLESGLDAFVARAALADLAERTLDLQYYIVHGDVSGRLLIGSLFDAAERGVRVRLLIDDWTLADADEALAQLDAHPAIEIRLFNPLTGRSWVDPARWADLVGDFSRINRRMHNKAWIADNVAAVVGGRNIGDEYFQARDDLDYHDLDLLSVGPVVNALSSSFDRYWNSEFSVPLSAFLRLPPDPERLDAMRSWFAGQSRAAAGTPYAESLANAELARALREGSLRLAWGDARVIADDPDKLRLSEDDPRLRASQRGLLLAGQLSELAPKPRSELLVVAPYFVPGATGVDSFGMLEREGVSVRILTNSLMSSDVLPAQAGYARYREALLEAGVELNELKPSGLGRDERPRRRDPIGGSSRAALHEKSLVIDREVVFVGSPNLDPRSIRTNTEVGVLVRSSDLAAQVAAIFERNASPQRAYRVSLDDGQLVWTTEESGASQRFTSEPEAGLWRRLVQGIYRLLAPERLL